MHKDKPSAKQYSCKVFKKICYRVKLKHFEKFQDTTEALAGTYLFILVIIHYTCVWSSWMYMLIRTQYEVKTVISSLPLRRHPLSLVAFRLQDDSLKESLPVPPALFSGHRFSGGKDWEDAEEGPEESGGQRGSRAAGDNRC